VVRDTTVQTHRWTDFAYEPPRAAHGARRIIIKPNLGYPVGPPVTVSDTVLGAVLRGCRAVAPDAELIVLEGVCSPTSLQEIAKLRMLPRIFDSGTLLQDADQLPLADYPHLGSGALRFGMLQAPALLGEADCRISIGACKRTVLGGVPLFSGALKNLFGLFPRSVYHARSPHSRGQLHRPSVPKVLEDVWWTVGHLFDGAVVDAGQKYHHEDWHPDRSRGTARDLGKVFTSDDLVSADLAAAQAAGEAEPTYLAAICTSRGW
jgi:uncharacterized protein (DUF362 family)